MDKESSLVSQKDVHLSCYPDQEVSPLIVVLLLFYPDFEFASFLALLIEPPWEHFPVTWFSACLIVSSRTWKHTNRKVLTTSAICRPIPDSDPKTKTLNMASCSHFNVPGCVLFVLGGLCFSGVIL